MKQLGYEVHEEINIGNHSERLQEMQQLSGQRSVPQIFIDEQHIGGFTDLYVLHQQGGLLPLLEK